MTKTETILLKLKHAREKNCLSQSFVADKLGVNRTTYARKEQGIIPITTGEWIILAETVGSTLTELFKNEAPPPATSMTVASEEKTLLTLYRSLDINEKKDLITTIRLLLKRINRSRVKKSLKELTFKHKSRLSQS